MTHRAFVVASLSLAWGLVVAVGAYAVVRAIQYFLYPDPNPATLVWSVHAGYFWRILTVSYAGGIAAFVAFLIARRRTDGAALGLARAIVAVAAMLALQAAFLP